MFKVEKFWAVRKFLNQAVFAERLETLTAFTACLHGTKKLTLIFFLTSLRGFFRVFQIYTILELLITITFVLCSVKHTVLKLRQNYNSITIFSSYRIF